MSDCNHSPTVQLWAMTNDGLCPRCLASDYDALRAEVERLESENDRLRQDRSDALNVRSRDGLLSSEWVARTGKAEREVAALKGLLTEWVADAHWNPRANLPDLVNRTKHAIGAARATDSASDPLTTPEAIKGNSPDPLIAQPDAPVCSFCGMPDCEYFDGECVAETVDGVKP